jgi:hypothetical protein
MTVASSSSVITYKGDGATTNFTFNFGFPAVPTPMSGANYLVVTYTDATGIPSAVAFGTGANNYQLSINPPIPPNPTSIGGTVTYAPGGNPIAAGTLFSIQRILPIVQPVSLVGQGALWQQVIEQEFDYLTMLAQGILTPAGGAVSSFNGRGGAVTLLAADISEAGGALIDSPNFTGVPTAPTPIPGTNTDEIATTKFVLANGGGPGNRVLLSSIVPVTPTLTVPMFHNFTNQFDQYEIDVYDLQSTATTTYTQFQMQISWDGTTFDTTNNYVNVLIAYYDTAPASGYAEGAAELTTGVFLGWSPNSISCGEYRIKFSMPWVTDRPKNIMSDSVSAPQSLGMARTCNAAQYYAQPAGLQPIKGFRFYDSGGFQITRGVFNLYGIVKASSGT